jgi:hypothetical protein
MRARFTPAILLTGFLLAPPLEAQEEEMAPPGITVVRYFECNMGGVGEAIGMLNGVGRTIAMELIEEGLLYDYGILTHAWGDEWNLIDYFVVENMPAFNRAWQEFLRRFVQVDPEGEMQARFTELCGRHKDNIYSIVQPPDGD